MINYLKSSLTLVVVLFKRARNNKNRAVIFSYFINNIIQKLLKKSKLSKEIFLEMKDLNFWFSTGKSELSPYLEICYNRIYEIDDLFIPKGEDVVFDIGGHIGFFTIRQAKRMNQGKIFVFEPNPNTFKQLLKNIRANGLKNVLSFNKAVTFRKSKTILHLAQESSEATTIMDKGTANNYSEKIEIETISLDEIVRNYHVSRINLMKIDVEGAEVEVLKSGLESALSLTEKIIIETHSYSLKEEVEKILDNLGFKIVLKIPSGKNALGENSLLYLSRT